MAEQYGIDNLKNAVSFTADLAEGVANVLDDGEVEITEVLQVSGGLVMGALTKLKGVKQIPAEAKDLSSQEADELVAFFANDFSIQNKEAEEFTEESMKLLAQIIKVGSLAKKLRGKAELKRTK